MAKVWVLDTETKGTGANVVPLEKAIEREPAPKRKPRNGGQPGSEPRPRRRPPEERERTATALPPGHVRKKSTGELGKVLAVDSRAGTVTVRWLRSGASSTVPLSAVARR
jgi:hypothetical protein